MSLSKLQNWIDYFIPRMPTAEQEAAFQERNSIQKFKLRRFFLFFGVLAFLAHGVLDYSTAGDGFVAIFSVRVIAVSLMMLISTFFIVSKIRLSFTADWLLVMYLGVAALAIIVMTVIANEGTAADTYPFGLVILFVYGGTVLLPSSRKTILMCAVSYGLFIATLPLSSISTGALVVNLFFMTFGLAGICIGTTFRERLERQQHLQNLSMKELNRDLEMSKTEAVYARDEALKANQVQSDFIASVSHELRTPLNAIIGFSEMMKGEVFGPLGATQYNEYSNDIHWSGNSLLMIVNDLLDTQRIATGKMSCVNERYSINEMIRHAIMLIEPISNEKNISLSYNASPLAFDAYGDSFRMSQALTNLLTNAIKFSPADSTIEITPSFMASGEYRITVADSGVGIPDEDLERILEPFAQIKQSAFIARENGGLGLGLSIVQGILSNMNYRLEIESSVGVGTRCHIFIPSDRLYLDDRANDETGTHDPADVFLARSANVVSLRK